MNTKRLPRPERVWICVGLLLLTLPLLLKEYIHIPDFLQGALEGTGLGFEVIGLFRLSKRKRTTPNL
jgi:hypothetical protein